MIRGQTFTAFVVVLISVASLHPQAVPPPPPKVPPAAVRPNVIQRVGIDPRMQVKRPTKNVGRIPPVIQVPKSHQTEMVILAPPKVPDQAKTAGGVDQPPKPSDVPAPWPPPGQDIGPWEGPPQVLYGATFNLWGKDPYTVEVEEAYEFVKSDDPSIPQVVAYCVQDENWTTADPPAKLCPRQEILNNRIDLKVSDRLQPETIQGKRTFYEEIALHSQWVWVELKHGQTRGWRVLNQYWGLKDAFSPDNRRMTTVNLPKNSFLSLDRGEQEPNQTMDIVHYPGILPGYSHDQPAFLLTRVSPRINPYLRWSVQKYLSAGVQNIVLQWLLLSAQTISPVALIAFFWNWFRRRAAPVGP